jgi:hypothetical protein
MNAGRIGTGQDERDAVLVARDDDVFLRVGPEPLLLFGEELDRDLDVGVRLDVEVRHVADRGGGAAVG